MTRLEQLNTDLELLQAALDALIDVQQDVHFESQKQVTSLRACRQQLSSACSDVQTEIEDVEERQDAEAKGLISLSNYIEDKGIMTARELEGLEVLVDEEDTYYINEVGEDKLYRSVWWLGSVPNGDRGAYVSTSRISLKID